MFIGRVTGTVVSTRKCQSLTGSKFLIVEAADNSKTLVAVDAVGAGVGETVLVVTGSAARVGNESVPIDALIVGIVDKN